MLQTIQFCFTEFSIITRLPNELRQYAAQWLWLLLIFGAAACLSGFFVYRAYFSAMLFFIIAYVSCLLLAGHIRWGATVTCFSVLGVAVALLGYGWNRLGGFVLCAVLGAWTGWSVYPSLILAVITGIICGVMLLCFPILSLSALTALSGSWLFWDSLAALGLLQLQSAARPAAIVLTAFAGFSLQLILSRKQSLFKKTCPDRITWWLEKRRKAHAANLSQGN